MSHFHPGNLVAVSSEESLDALLVLEHQAVGIRELVGIADPHITLVGNEFTVEMHSLS